MSEHILLVDDDALLRTSLAFNLGQAGYRASMAASAEDGLAAALQDPPALILLDVGLPGMDGFQAVALFREQIGKPVILLTARASEMDETWGLAQGADDYVTKPFSLPVLLAHIHSVLRRSNGEAMRSQDGALIEAGDVHINRATHVVRVRDRLVELRPREFDLLVYLAQRPEQVVTAQELLMQVWGPEYAGEPQVVYVTVSRLRVKLEDRPADPPRIVSLRGIGYKLVPQPDGRA